MSPDPAPATPVIRGKVLFLIENASAPGDRRSWMEAQTLAEAGCKVSIISPRRVYKKFYERIGGISIYRYPLPSFAGIAGHLLEYGIAVPVMFLLTWVVLIREGFDVIHAANPPDLLYLIARVFKLLGKKFVFDHHDLVPEACLTRWSGVKLKLVYPLATWAERATFRTADAVISTNESHRQVALQRGQIAPERVFIVRSAIRTTDYRQGQPRPELRRGREHLVGYLGEIGVTDGVDLLLLTARYIAFDRHRTDIGFAILGDGVLFNEIVKMRERLSLNDVVHLTGWVSDDSLIADYLATADVCAVPDPKNPVNDRSTMNKVVEYMAMGRPVVAYDLHEVRDTAQNAGVYVRSNDPREFGDAILELLDSPEKRRAMSQEAIKRFTEVLAWEHQRPKLLSAYQLILNDDAARATAAEGRKR